MATVPHRRRRDRPDRGRCAVDAVAPPPGRGQPGDPVGGGRPRRTVRRPRSAASDAEPDRVVDAGRQELTELLDLHDCRYERALDTALPRLNRDGTIERPRGPITVSLLSRQGFEMPAEGLELTVVGGGRSPGRYVLVPRAEQGLSVEQGLVAVALADQVGHTLHAASFDTAPPAAGR